MSRPHNTTANSSTRTLSTISNSHELPRDGVIYQLRNLGVRVDDLLNVLTLAQQQLDADRTQVVEAISLKDRKKVDTMTDKEKELVNKYAYKKFTLLGTVKHLLRKKHILAHEDYGKRGLLYLTQQRDLITLLRDYYAHDISLLTSELRQHTSTPSDENIQIVDELAAKIQLLCGQIDSLNIVIKAHNQSITETSATIYHALKK